MLKLRKNKKGFTLVELIVVVAIMAVLAGTVAGVVVSTQNKTKNSQANTSANGIAKQIQTLLNSDADTNTLFETKGSSGFSGFKTDKSGNYLVYNDINASDDYKNSLVILTDSGKVDKKAGSNKYNIYVDNKNGAIYVMYVELGGSKDKKGYKVSYNATENRFDFASASM